jgi:hypothetical protein
MTMVVRTGGVRRRIRAATAWCFVVAALALSRGVLACPNCRLGGEVRERVFGDAFWSNLTIALLPLTVLVIIAALLHRIGRPAHTGMGCQRRPT